VHTPMKQYGNYMALNKLQKADLFVDAKFDGKNILVNLTNTSNTIALFNELKLLDENNDWVVPAFYSDNYFSLLPGEVKEIKIDFENENMLRYELFLSGWNIEIQKISFSQVK